MDMDRVGISQCTIFSPNFFKNSVSMATFKENLEKMEHTGHIIFVLEIPNTHSTYNICKYSENAFF
jgi:hypothetical protein